MPNTRSLASDHRRHDWLLIARFAAGDAQFGQDEEARDLVRRCTECAALAADIGHISRAVGQLPAAARPRDFRLTVEQADGLRGSRLERWLRTLAGPGWATVRPVAAMALSVGLVMSVVGALPIVGAAAPGSSFEAFATDRNFAAAPTSDTTNGDGNPSVPPPNPPQTGTGAMVDPVQTPLQELWADRSPVLALDDPLNNAYVLQSPGVLPAPDQTASREKAAVQTGLGLRQALIYAGLGLVALALVVLALVYAARQRFRDPLLR